MLQKKFVKVFSLNINHSYFDGGLSDSWDIKANSSTLELLNKYTFKSDLRSGRFDLYVPISDALTIFLDTFINSEDQEYFEFIINSFDDRIFMATDVPINERGYLSFDNHSENNKVLSDKVELEGKWVPESDSHQLMRIRIYFDDLLKRSASNQGANYQINLLARSTQWQYFIINGSGAKNENLKIVGNSEIKFVGPEDVTLTNGQAAFKFWSDEVLLPLSETQKFTFDLVSENNPGENNLILKGLPSADARQLDKVEIDGEMVLASPIYVYI